MNTENEVAEKYGKLLDRIEKLARDLIADVERARQNETPEWADIQKLVPAKDALTIAEYDIDLAIR